MSLMEKMQKKAFNHIKENMKVFFDNLEMVEEGKDFAKFRGKKNVKEVLIKQRIVKKLLARIYLTVIEAHLDSELEGSAELRVEGFISKKGVRFHGSGRIAEILNAQSDIISALHDIDIEEVRVKGEKGKVRITIVPYSSSFVWIFIPPVSYNVRLSEDEGRKLLNLIESMGSVLSRF